MKENPQVWKGRTRRPCGASMVALVLVIAFFAVLPLSLFGFEMSRVVMMQQQLQACADAAALAGTAALASANNSGGVVGISQAQDVAMQAAYYTFTQNSVLQTAFTTNTTGRGAVQWLPLNPANGAAPAGPPPMYQAILTLSLWDQTRTIWQSTGSTSADTIKVQAQYTDAPIFASALSTISPLPLTETIDAVSFGGLPQLDLVLCFDISGSMDDQTNVTLVRRYWTGSSVAYTNVGTTNTIFNIGAAGPTGTQLNATQPQNLAQASTGNFNSALRCSTNFGSLVQEQGGPPGNFTNPWMPIGATDFTDMVVTAPFTYTYNGISYNFPNQAVCIEASRGNLENSTVLQESQGYTTNAQLSGITPQSGYYNAYWNYVLSNASPIAAARSAATQFFDTMNTSGNSHFGLVTFATTIGSPSGTYSWQNIDPSYSYGGTGTFPFPEILLSSTNSNYPLVDTTVAGGGNGGATPPAAITALTYTDIADSLTAAINMLSGSGARKAAKKAVILFTDGVANEPGGTTTTGSSLALNAASTASGLGIPIYTIGLSQNPSIQPMEATLLGDNQNGSGQGIAYVSANGAIYVQTTSASQLNEAFQTIARSLVVLQ